MWILIVPCGLMFATFQFRNHPPPRAQGFWVPHHLLQPPDLRAAVLGGAAFYLRFLKLFRNALPQEFSTIVKCHAAHADTSQPPSSMDNPEEESIEFLRGSPVALSLSHPQGHPVQQYSFWGVPHSLSH